MPSLLEHLEGERATKQTALATLLTEAAEHGVIAPDKAKVKIDEIAALNANLKELTDQIMPLRQAQADQAAREQMDATHRKWLDEQNRPIPAVPHALPGQPLPGAGVVVKSLGAQFVDGLKARQFKAGTDKESGWIEVDGVGLKTTFSTAAGWAPPNDRGPLVVLSAQRTPVVADLLPTDNVAGLNSVTWMEETTNTNNAGFVAEGGTTTDSAFALTEQSQAVRRVSAALPITDEQLADVGQAESFINTRLTLQMRQKEEVGLLSGDGNAPNLQGFLTKTGVQTQARGADPNTSAIYEAITLVRYTGFANPTGIIAHPNNWKTIVLMQDLNGNYIFGPPSAEVPQRLWGLPVIVTTAMTANTIFVGDFVMYSHLSRRQGYTLSVTNAHASEFLTATQHVRMDARLSLEIYRAAAFAKVTGAN